MKSLNIFFLSILMVLLSCNEEVPSIDFQDDPSITSIEGNWKLIQIFDADGEIITKTEDNSWGYDVAFTIDDNGDPFEIYGKNTTNQIFGGFDYLEGRAVQVYAIGTTYVNQPEWGNKFSKVFYSAKLTYSVNSDWLRLRNEEEGMEILLERY